MMGKQSGQIQMVILDIDSMIPEDHLLRGIKKGMLTKSRILCPYGIIESSVADDFATLP